MAPIASQGTRADGKTARTSTNELETMLRHLESVKNTKAYPSSPADASSELDGTDETDELTCFGKTDNVATTPQPPRRDPSQPGAPLKTAKGAPAIAVSDESWSDMVEKAERGRATQRNAKTAETEGDARTKANARDAGTKNEAHDQGTKREAGTKRETRTKHEAETDVDAETELDPELKGDTVLEMLTGLKYAVVHAFIPSANERKNILAIINEITAKTKAIQESAQAKTNEDIAEIKSMLKAKPTYAQALQAKLTTTDVHTAQALAVAKYSQQERLHKEREKLNVMLRLDDKGKLAKELSGIKDTDLLGYNPSHS